MCLGHLFTYRDFSGEGKRERGDLRMSDIYCMYISGTIGLAFVPDVGKCIMVKDYL